MPNPRKNPPTLTTTDLSVKRLIEFHPATVADITHVLQMTTAQVRASIEKLEARNEVLKHPYIDSGGKRNIYYPKQAIDRNHIRGHFKAIRRLVSEGWDMADTPEDKVSLMVVLDRSFKIVYNGLAGLANMRKDDPANAPSDGPE